MRDRPLARRSASRAPLPLPPPPSLAKIAELARGVDVMCSGCFRQVGFAMPALIALAGAGATIDGVRGRLRCSSCGTRGAGTSIAWGGRPAWCIGYIDHLPAGVDR